MKSGDIQVNVVDGRRHWFPAKDILVQLWRNANEVAHEHWYDANSITLTFPVRDNTEDQFRVVVYADGHLQSGYHPVQLEAGKTAPVYLMLVPKNTRPDFSDAHWLRLPATSPRLRKLLESSQAQSDYEAFLDNHVPCATLLNIATAMDDIQLPKHPLEYYTRIIWEDNGHGPRPDRFFGFADPQLIQDIKGSGKQFSEEHDPARKGHPGATCSFKQSLFEANVQLTFHENTKDTDGTIMVEADMDYFAGQLSHFFLEVIPNLGIFGGKTDPRRIYVLRWMAARQNNASFNRRTGWWREAS